MHLDRSAGRTAGRPGTAVTACAAVTACVALLSAVDCSTDAGTGVRVADDAPLTRDSATAPAQANGRTAHARPAPSTPEPAVLARATVHLSDGQTVGVGMPISVTFPQPVPAADRKAVEDWLRVRTSSAATGAWSWVKGHNLLDGQRVDFRPSTTKSDLPYLGKDHILGAIALAPADGKRVYDAVRPGARVEIKGRHATSKGSDSACIDRQPITPGR
ncbi:hypothetical protein SAMN05428944_0493 [Streptomyces sp. 1222.5]|uniref:Ig-like domain-containing protein n=1 Tax=unclassified Streptomyces TaxID=2593676 RepID=UPI00089A7076|nr:MULTISPECIES: Ig-like domain-containing protein [unclassified Streptomyces]PKW12259.1 hypothetical protein BX260_7603 [Streptomyces sp. 5112.2]SEB59586.1 hypothetical protein SAMN05428944_0493 [Streptomyces sp. 1222.5]